MLVNQAKNSRPTTITLERYLNNDYPAGDQVNAMDLAIFRSEYFNGGEIVKVIDRDWGSLGLDDPRAQSWKYWYGKTLATDHETWAVIPEEVVKVDQDWPSDKWSKKTLRRIKR